MGAITTLTAVTENLRYPPRLSHHRHTGEDARVSPPYPESRRGGRANPPEGCGRAEAPPDRPRGDRSLRLEESQGSTRSRAGRPARSPLRACPQHQHAPGRAGSPQVGRRRPRGQPPAREAHPDPRRHNFYHRRAEDIKQPPYYRAHNEPRDHLSASPRHLLPPLARHAGGYHLRSRRNPVVNRDRFALLHKGPGVYSGP